MTLTVHVLAGAALGRLAPQRTRYPKVIVAIVFLLSCAGHVLLDRLRHGHPPAGVDLLLCATIVAIIAGRGLRPPLIAGILGAVLPDAFHFLPKALDLFHPAGRRWIETGLSPAMNQVLAALLLLPIAFRPQARDARRKKTAPAARATDAAIREDGYRLTDGRS